MAYVSMAMDNERRHHLPCPDRRWRYWGSSRSTLLPKTWSSREPRLYRYFAGRDDLPADLVLGSYEDPRPRARSRRRRVQGRGSGRAVGDAFMPFFAMPCVPKGRAGRDDPSGRQPAGAARGRERWSVTVRLVERPDAVGVADGVHPRSSGRVRHGPVQMRVGGLPCIHRNP